VKRKSKTPYAHQAWRTVRQEVLERDNYQCQIRGPKCKGKATEADHIIPWAAGGAMYDLGNLQAACKSCNVARANTTKHKEGWRRSKARIILVSGPPGAGKTTYAYEHAGERDLVVDYDAISKALHPGTDYQSAQGHEVTMAARNAVLREIRRGEVKAETIYICSTNPNATQIFPYHEIALVDPGRDEVMKRVEDRHPDVRQAAERWYAKQAKQAREW